MCIQLQWHNLILVLASVILEMCEPSRTSNDFGAWIGKVYLQRKNNLLDSCRVNAK